MGREENNYQFKYKKYNCYCNGMIKFEYFKLEKSKINIGMIFLGFYSILFDNFLRFQIAELVLYFLLALFLV